MKYRCLRSFLSLLVLVICHRAWAQETVAGPQANDRALSNVRHEYMKVMGINSFLYTGSAYDRYWGRIPGHPFFLTDSFSVGTLYYDGTLYEEVPMRYDMLRNQVVSKTFDRSADLALLGEKISYFTIGTHLFIRLATDSFHQSGIKSGFYERLYHGATTVLAKRENRVEIALKAEDKSSKFTAYNSFYIEKNGVYHPVVKEADLRAVFSDQQAEIRKFLNRRAVSFKKDPEAAIVQTAVYYDGLTK